MHAPAHPNPSRISAVVNCLGRLVRTAPLLLLLLAPVLLLGAPACAVQAQVPVQVQGSASLRVRVVNGTPGGGNVTNLPLAVYSVEVDKEQLVSQGRTSGNGTFTWPALTAAVGTSYVVSTTYAGVAYQSEPITVSTTEVTLPVYETTGADSALRISSAGMVVLNVDAATQVLKVLETLTLSNAGTRTFLPSTTGPSGPMGLLRFGLPDGAGNLAPYGRLGGSNIIQVNTGFASDLPVPPGTTDVSFTYELAYGALTEGGYALLSKNISYPTDLLRVLVPRGDFTAQSPQLADKGAVTVGTRAYRRFEGKDLQARTAVSLELRNLPLDQPALRSRNPWLQLAMGGLVLAAAALPLLYKRRQARQGALSYRVAPSSPGFPSVGLGGAVATLEGTQHAGPRRVRRVANSIQGKGRVKGE